MSKKIVAFVAARMGSTRVPFKNVRMLNGYPLFYYLTRTAQRSTLITDLYINTDSERLIKVAREYFEDNIGYYLRNSALGTSKASLDEYVYDFLLHVDCDIVIFLNPCSPLLSVETLDSAISEFVEGNYSSMAASERMQTHTFLKDEPVNFSFSAKQPRSQDLDEVHCMTSGFFIWNAQSFKDFYKRHGHANFMPPFKSYGLNKIEALDIDNEDEWHLVESVLRRGECELQYHPIVADAIRNGEIKAN